MKKYSRKPLRVFKWDGEPNEHVKHVGPVRGDLPCDHCGELTEKHGMLVKPLDSALSVFCKGYWVLVDDEGVSEYIRPTRFKAQYEEDVPVMCAWCKKKEATSSICHHCWRRLG